MKKQCNITGKIKAIVYDKEGNIKQISENHNIVTDLGDAYVADLLSNTPTRTKITNSSGYIPVGTNWTGINPKANTWVNTQTGSAKALSPTYPKVKGAWGEADDNVLQFRVLYTAGELNATITEAAITSHPTNSSANTLLAYAQITPAAMVTTSDSLEILWEITFIGT